MSARRHLAESCLAAVLAVAALPPGGSANGTGAAALRLAQTPPAVPAAPFAATPPAAKSNPPAAAPQPATAPPEPKSPSAKANPPPPKNLETLPAETAAGILGKKVWSTNGTDLGLVIDVIVDADGHPRAAVIDFGGFLGVGTRKIAVDWRLLRFAPGAKDRQVLLSLGRAEIQAAPAFKPGAPVEMVGPPPEAAAPTHGDK